MKAYLRFASVQNVVSKEIDVECMNGSVSARAGARFFHALRGSLMQLFFPARARFPPPSRWTWVGWGGPLSEPVGCGAATLNRLCLVAEPAVLIEAPLARHLLDGLCRPLELVLAVVKLPLAQELLHASVVL